MIPDKRKHATDGLINNMFIMINILLNNMLNRFNIL